MNEAHRGNHQMDRIAQYRQIITQLLDEYAGYERPDSNIELETIFDTERDRYQLVALGWKRKKRVHGCIFHIDIKNGKVWLQHDATDAQIAEQLVEMGIPKEELVLAFYTENRRRYTGFAVN